MKTSKENSRKINSKSEIERFLRRNTFWHLYALADLDDEVWAKTEWFGHYENDTLKAVALILRKLATPLLYAVSSPGCKWTRTLVSEILPRLPHKFYAHVGKGVLDGIPKLQFDKEGLFQKMILTTPNFATSVSATRCHSFEELKRFYSNSAYDDNLEERFFEEFMLKMGPYFVVRHDGEIVSAGGVHILSKDYGVAALGNIATSKHYRGKGYGRAVTAAAAKELSNSISNIGLNVKKDNVAAIKCYRAIGFTRILDFEEGPVQIV